MRTDLLKNLFNKCLFRIFQVPEKAENKKIKDRKTADLWTKSDIFVLWKKVTAIIKTQKQMNYSPS